MQASLHAVETQLAAAPDAALLEQARRQLSEAQGELRRVEREAAGGARQHSEEAEGYRQRAAALGGEVTALQAELATLRSGAAPLDGSGTYDVEAGTVATVGREQGSRAAAKVLPKVVAGRAGSPEAPFAGKAESTVPAAAESPA
tara:strand:- start:66 stop:500 length:435 start_codon:yes stop_codon:yes gene_type:complete